MGLNCFKKRTSFSVNKRRSLIWFLSMAIRSMPIPKAKPVYLVESMPQFSRTFGSTMPAPPISTQPLYLQTLQPLPPQIRQEMSISALGSVNGKNEGGIEPWFPCQIALWRSGIRYSLGQQNLHFHPHKVLLPDGRCSVHGQKSLHFGTRVLEKGFGSAVFDFPSHALAQRKCESVGRCLDFSR